MKFFVFSSGEMDADTMASASEIIVPLDKFVPTINQFFMVKSLTKENRKVILAQYIVLQIN